MTRSQANNRRLAHRAILDWLDVALGEEIVERSRSAGIR